MTAAPSPLLLSYPDANATFHWQSLSQAERQRPVTITIGTLGKTTDGIAKLESLTSPQLNLVHFRCYGLSALQELPELPFGLISLDLQHLPSPTTLPDLPRGLLRLTLIGLTSLRDLREIPQMEKLRVLTLKGLPMLSSNSINRLLNAAPHLKQLRLQGCGSLENITQWPPELEAVWLEDSPVTKLPEAWPQRGPLHTVSLKGCSQMTSAALPAPEALPPSVTMVNLAGCRRLKQLPIPEKRAPFPHTLHLAGSGILKPLKSQHGADANANVAAETQRYFAALRLLDNRQVARCKILILGNGRAGKTFLTRALRRRKVTMAEVSIPEHKRPPELRSTHGIQFHPWEDFVPKAKILERDRDLVPHVHLWDFGGQELYHNTHKLFVRSGCLFVLVWNPDHDGQAAEIDPVTGMQDVWRPLAYWFHLIRTSSEYKETAEIILVHSHRPDHSRNYTETQLRNQWMAQAGDLADRVRFFSVNSLDDGQSERNLPELIEELKVQTGHVIDAQGTAVPAHWDIALKMVERWVEDPAYQQMSIGEFGKKLNHEIREILWNQGRQFPDTKKAWNRTFRLDREAVLDTLRFLDHSGWVFWHEARMPDTVIIGQKWAMEGIYAFTRREGVLSDYLEQSGGLIRSSQVRALKWGSPRSDRPYTPTEHNILFDYAVSCGVIFPLNNREERNWGETIYAVYDRLPKNGNADWALPHDSPKESKTELPLTRAPWNRFLEECGQTFGTSGQYAQSAFRVETEDHQVIHATFDLRANGIHADVTVQATTLELAKKIFARITQEGARTGEALHSFKAKSASRVFVSYSWDVSRPDFDPVATLHVDVLSPVEAITAHLDPIPHFHLIRDKSAMEVGDSIPDFITEAISNSEHILCIFSERYFHRPWCLLELSLILKRVNEDPNEFFKLVTPVLLPGVTFTEDDINRRWEFWSKRENVRKAKAPKALGNTWQAVQIQIGRTLKTIGQIMGPDTLRSTVHWNPGNKDVSLRLVQERLPRSTTIST